MRESEYQNVPCISLIQCNSGVNHGTFLHIAHEEGLIRNTSIHAGIRAPVVRPKGDVRNDLRCGFEMVKARAIDRLGIAGIIDKLKSRVAGTKVYISVDIDVLDPAFAPDGLEGLDVVGADVGTYFPSPVDLLVRALEAD
ncbi:uncharacterized protein J4E87_006016 [Alternaria ethzedia]|uniref:uncharacterized protein n=1 Tax=Alternaria ethzedia TaxID=181014 RepID=UPI0020C26809|nr:uncharacterized protein J4E87_006016 [Alternaria ethzedia]KAI4622923.1 hypothetical protein J4E87_006016 [Alternaria ethzedia]